MISVHHQKNIQASSTQLLDILLDHKNLNQLFNASFSVVSPAEPSQPNGGRGCVRKVSLLGISFYEEIIAANEQGISYRVLDDFPVKQHRGHIQFSSHNNGTRVSYRIDCQAPWYIPSTLLRLILRKDIKRCLTKLGAIYGTC